jgi:hypothetical protein
VLESGCSSLAPRHSPYYRADDRLSATDASVWLAVEDDGICFDITAARGTGPGNLRYTTLAVVMQLGAGGRARLVLPEWDTGRPVSTPAAPTIPCPQKSRVAGRFRPFAATCCDQREDQNVGRRQRRLLDGGRAGGVPAVAEFAARRSRLIGAPPPAFNNRR